MTDPKPRTHTAYSMQRIGKKYGPWLEIGSGRIDEDGVHVFLDRMTIGWTGYVRLVPRGEPPPMPQPQRPAGAGDDEELEN
jgi:hypothetical protein